MAETYLSSMTSMQSMTWPNFLSLPWKRRILPTSHYRAIFRTEVMQEKREIGGRAAAPTYIVPQVKERNINGMSSHSSFEKGSVNRVHSCLSPPLCDIGFGIMMVFFTERVRDVKSKSATLSGVIPRLRPAISALLSCKGRRKPSHEPFCCLCLET